MRITTLSFFTKSLMLAFFAVIFASCVGPRKIDGWIDDHYGAVAPSKKTPKPGDVSILTTLPSLDGNSRTEKDIRNLLPFLFYWRWDYVNTSTLNPQLPIRNFSSAVQSYASSKKVKDKLAGRTLELVIDSIPNIMVINNRTNMIWVVYAFSWDKITIAPAPGNMVISYTLLQGSEKIKSGTVTTQGRPYLVAKGYFQRLKNLTGEYLYMYDETIKTMGKSAIDKILQEI